MSNVDWTSLPKRRGEALYSGGGGGTYDVMERIAKLEARADASDQSLTRIEAKLDKIVDTVSTLPTANGLWGMIATVIGVGLAIAGMTFVVADYAARFSLPPS